MKKKKIAAIGIAVIFLMPVFISCGQGPNDDNPVFAPSEYRIPASETLERLNIADPKHIYSQDENVATAKIETGDIIITSVEQGGTSVLVGDYAGLCNSAQISIDVDATGKIVAQISRFDEGKRVEVIIKQDVLIAGTVGIAISQKVIGLQMNGNHFIAINGTDVSAWIQNFPQGLTAAISYVQSGEYPHELDITISGTPQSACTDALHITIPSIHNPTPWDVHAETRSGAKFDILE